MIDMTTGRPYGSHQLDKKRRIVAAVQDVHTATVEAMRRLREEGQRQLEPLRQACAETGGHVFSAGRDPAGRACVFCGALEPRDLPPGVSAEKAAAVGLLARHLGLSGSSEAAT